MKKASDLLLLLRGGILTYGFALVGQFLSAAAGLIVVNILPKDQFAAFAVFTAILQTFVASSDLGTSAATSYFYREHPNWNSFKATALPAIARMRTQFFLLGGVVIVALFVNSSAVEITAAQTTELLVLALATACFGMVNALQGTVLAVRGDAITSVRIDAASSLVRLLLVLGMMVFNLISAEAALVASLLSAIFSFFLGRLNVPEIPLGLPREYNKQEQRRLLRYVFPLIPGFVYSAVQPSMLIWLSAMFGNSEQVAEVGAISRIGQIIGFLGFGLNLLALPHLASLRDETTFRRSYIHIWLILIGLVSVVMAGVTIWRAEILLLLGSKYSNLESELLLVAGTSVFYLLAGYATIVNRVRGWNKLEPIVTVAQFATQATLIVLLPLNTTATILLISLIFAIVSLFIMLSINIIGFVMPRWAALRDTATSE